MNDKTAHFIARHLPKRIVMWCAIVVASHATTGKYGKTVVPELGALEAYDRYAKDNNLYD